jgi:transcriptional regulator with XRE-family HTH domain
MSSEEVTDDVREETPGGRLKYIREKLLKLTRADIQKKHSLSPDTLAAWENGKNPLTEKGLERCIGIFSNENLIVSREWLLTGEGLDPALSFDLNRYFTQMTTRQPDEKLNDTILLAKEIEFFRSLSSDSVTGLIANEDMLPLYARGDHVGGRFLYGDNIEACIGKDCIVHTKDGATYIRRVSKNADNKTYNLSCLNPSWSGSPEPVIFGVDIDCAAPIIWHRRAGTDY